MDILEKYLKNRKKVEIEIITEYEDSCIYKTNFYKCLDDKYLIYRPQQDINFEINQRIKLFIYTSVGIFILTTRILSLNSKIIEIEKNTNYKIIQRRGMLRADLKIPITINIKNNKQLKFYTKNISGSGLAFDCDELLDKKTLFDVELSFENRRIYSRIKIVEIRKNTNPDLPKYRYSVKMLSLNRLDEDYIMKLCIVNDVQTIFM